MKILVLNDICSHGQVAINSIKPCLEKVGANVFSVPTCLISSTFNKPKVAIEDTSKYLTQCLDIYNSEIEFDFIIVGFVYNKEQASAIMNFIKQQHKAKVLVDPTMADNGKMYQSLGEENLEYIKELCSVSDIIVPNVTEARFLTDMFQNKDVEVTKKLKKLYRSIIITSIDNKKIYVYDREKDIEEMITYDAINGNYPGTGDLFVGLMISSYLTTRDLVESSKYAAKKITDILKVAKSDIEVYNGIPISKYL